MNDHLSETQISGFRERSLPAEILLSVSRHLCACSACRERVESPEEIHREIAEVRRALEQADPHLSYEEIMGFAAGELTAAESARVKMHVASCEACESDLADAAGLPSDAASDESPSKGRFAGLATGPDRPEFPGVGHAEDGGMRAGWSDRPTTRNTTQVWSWLRWPVSVAACAGLAALLISLWRPASSMRPALPKISREPSGDSASAPSASVVPFALVKPPVRIPAAAVLIYRSDREGAQEFLKDLASALEPYRNDNYTEAARLLGDVCRKYPNAPEPAFYLGACRLFLNQNEDAIESFDKAGRHAEGPLRDDVLWYRVLALQRAGKSEEVSRALEVLCGRAGEHRSKACIALKARQ